MTKPKRYITISEPIFRDLIGAKSKIEDIKVMLYDVKPRTTKQQLLEQLTVLAYSSRYQEEEHGDGKQEI